MIWPFIDFYTKNKINKKRLDQLTLSLVYLVYYSGDLKTEYLNTEIVLKLGFQMVGLLEMSLVLERPFEHLESTKKKRWRPFIQYSL